MTPIPDEPRVCVVCRDALPGGEGAEVHACSACGVRAHPDCRASLPRCPTIGCHTGLRPASGRATAPRSALRREAWQVRAALALVLLGLPGGLLPLGLVELRGAPATGEVTATYVHVDSEGEVTHGFSYAFLDAEGRPHEGAGNADDRDELERARFAGVAVRYWPPAPGLHRTAPGGYGSLWRLLASLGVLGGLVGGLLLLLSGPRARRRARAHRRGERVPARVLAARRVEDSDGAGRMWLGWEWQGPDGQVRQGGCHLPLSSPLPRVGEAVWLRVDPVSDQAFWEDEP